MLAHIEQLNLFDFPNFLENNKILLFIQLFFYYSPIDTLTLLPQLIKPMKPLKSIQQLIFLCKLIAPFIQKISFDKELMSEVKFHF